jgi:hypothetical protein
LPDFFAAAQRFFIASAIRLRAAAEMRRRAEVRLLLFPGGRPRRSTLVPAPPTPFNALIAESNLLLSSLQLPNDLVYVHLRILAS